MNVNFLSTNLKITGIAFLSFGLSAICGLGSAEAAERVILSFGGITIAEATFEQVLDFAKTGNPSPSVQGYLNVLNLSPKQAQMLLTTEAPLPPAIVDKALNSQIGEALLDQISAAITTTSLAAGIPAIKAALLISSGNDGKVSILEIIQNYPLTELRIEGSKLQSSVAAVQSFAGTIASTQAGQLNKLLTPSVVAAVVPLPSGQPTASTMGIIYVDPQSGQDSPSNGKSISAPLRTITFALRGAASGSVIQLSSGQFTSATGEVFPLIVPSAVTIQGQIASQGQGVLIEGSGSFLSRTFGKQNVTMVGQSNAQILGITVTNRESRGTGIWVESANPIIRSSTFTNSLREGIFVAGNSAPIIENNVFTKNSANGLSIVNSSSGEIRGNNFQQTGFGISIGGDSSPLIENNQIQQNRSGIVIGNKAKPTLRGNRIASNSDDGVVVIPGAQPNLTNGSNSVQSNGRFDLYASQDIINAAGGNQISKSSVLVIGGQTGVDK